MERYMTSKERAYLKGLAMTMEPVFQLGKASLTPENTKAIREALEARELIKIKILQNCLDDPNEIAVMVAERTHSQVVQVIGKKIVLYKKSKTNPKFELNNQSKKVSRAKSKRNLKSASKTKKKMKLPTVGSKNVSKK